MIPVHSRPGGRSRRGRFLALLATPMLALPFLPAAATPSPAASTSPTEDLLAGQSDPYGAAPAGLEVPDEPVAVTLITGDKVLYGGQDLGQGQGGTENQTGFDVEPALRESGVPVDFSYEQNGEDFYVFPSDAEALIGEGVLDRELFNVAGLIEQGYDDKAAGGTGIPVLATFTKDLKTEAQVREQVEDLPGVKDRTVSAVPAADAAGVKVDRGKAGQFWNAVAADRSNRGGNKDKNTDGDSGGDASPALGAGVAELRLDALFEISLDVSVPQIGAPQAWEAGYTGEGVTVAVLDTGVDQSHPDLAGQVVQAEDFTDEGTPADTHGHGTHVASTIAGTGAASDGQYTGVAPDADLISGKVCDAGGQCQESDIMAAMEWAAESGADVVNMSLGGAVTDGTDQVSQLVNTLTEESGTLFVIAAGNSGGPSQRVSTPAAADAALAVGAVDKSDQLALFSSRGPRVGDGAVKPEITGPGVGIWAARAGGTSMGGCPERSCPRTDDHIQVSGTSMATPHVAGAAAILAQAEPGLSALELKDVLVSTAVDGGYQWLEQGTGRVDVPAAVDAEVYASASVNLGRLGTGQTAQGEVTYTNTTDADVTLDLAYTVTDTKGNPVEGVALSTDTITVPAGGTAAATITADADAVGEGYFGGVVTATTEDISLRTAVGLVHLNKIKMTVLDSTGDPVGNDRVPEQNVVLIQDTYDHDNPVGALGDTIGTVDGTAVAYVPSGTYTAIVSANEHDTDGITTRRAHVVEQEFTVDGDVEFTLDTRETVLVEQPTVPDEVEVRGRSWRTTHDYVDHPLEYTFGVGGSWFTALGSPTYPVLVSPTPTSERAFTSRWDYWLLAEPQPMHGTPGREHHCEAGIHQFCYSPTPAYIYQLPTVHMDGIPDDLSLDLTRKDLVEWPQQLHADSPDTLIRHQYGPRPAYYAVWANIWANIEPGEFTEYYLPDDGDLAWSRANTWFQLENPYQMILASQDMFTEDMAGTSRDVEHWFQAPLRVGNAPEIDDAYREHFQKWHFGRTPIALPHRGGPDGNTFVTGIQEMDNDGHVNYRLPQFATSRMWNLDTEEELTGAADYLFELNPEPARYRLEQAESYRNGLWSRFADETGAPLFQTKPTATTVWEFESRPSDAATPDDYQCWYNTPDFDCQIQPIINLSYGLDLDTYNRAPAGRAHKFTITARHHTHAIDRAKVTDLSVEASFDDGQTWEEVTVTPGKGKNAEGEFITTVRHPKLDDTTGFVSLRVKAEDASGGTVEQTMERAYILK